MVQLGRPPKVTDEQVVTAAARVFASKGYYWSRLEDVADELDITKGAIYYRFPTKELLRQEVHSALLNRALHLSQEVLAEDGNPLDQLRKLVQVHFQVTYEMPDHATTWMQRLSTYNNKESDESHALRTEYEEIWMGVLRECGIASGDESRLMAKLIFGALNWMHLWYHPESSMSRGEVSSYAASWVVAGVIGSLENLMGANRCNPSPIPIPNFIAPNPS